jgi:hypothetical protein
MRMRRGWQGMTSAAIEGNWLLRGSVSPPVSCLSFSRRPLSLSGSASSRRGVRSSSSRSESTSTSAPSFKHERTRHHRQTFRAAHDDSSCGSSILRPQQPATEQHAAAAQR